MRFIFDRSKKRIINIDLITEIFICAEDELFKVLAHNKYTDENILLAQFDMFDDAMSYFFDLQKSIT